MAGNYSIVVLGIFIFFQQHFAVCKVAALPNKNEYVAASLANAVIGALSENSQQFR